MSDLTIEKQRLVFVTALREHLEAACLVPIPMTTRAERINRVSKRFHMDLVALIRVAARNGWLT